MSIRDQIQDIMGVEYPGAKPSTFGQHRTAPRDGPIHPELLITARLFMDKCGDVARALSTRRELRALYEFWAEWFDLCEWGAPGAPGTTTPGPQEKFSYQKPFRVVLRAIACGLGHVRVAVDGESLVWISPPEGAKDRTAAAMEVTVDPLLGPHIEELKKTSAEMVSPPLRGDQKAILGTLKVLEERFKGDSVLRRTLFRAVSEYRYVDEEGRWFLLAAVIDGPAVPNAWSILEEKVRSLDAIECVEIHYRVVDIVETFFTREISALIDTISGHCARTGKIARIRFYRICSEVTALRAEIFLKLNYIAKCARLREDLADQASIFEEMKSANAPPPASSED